jgi:hypothetical protein
MNRKKTFVWGRVLGAAVLLLITPPSEGQTQVSPSLDAAGTNPDVKPPAVSSAVKAGNRYVICEAYPTMLAYIKGETSKHPWYQPESDFAFSSGCNWPTRMLPEYVRFTKDPMGYARYDIHMAKVIGIDAFCLGDTGYGEHTQFADVLWDYWNAAREDGNFKLIPYALLLNKEDGSEAGWQHLQDSLHILSRNYRDEFLQIDGKYVLHDWTANPRTATNLVTSEDMGPILDGLGGPEKVYLIQQTTYLANWTPVPGINDWDYNSPSVKQFYNTPSVTQFKALVQKYASSLTQFQAESYGDLPAMERGLEGAAKELGKEVVYPVMQSFYQSRWQFSVEGGGSWPGGRICEKLGFAGCYYQWRRAIDSHARIVYITTWNDLTEDHSVMPEELHGYAYYELTKYFIKWFKSGTRPPVEKEQILLFHHPQLTEKPLQTPPRAFLAGRYENQATPPTDYIGVVVMLKRPAKVTVEMGMSSTGIPNTRLASRDFPAGTNFWLIYHPLSNATLSAVPLIGHGSNHPKDAHPVYPEEREDFFITKLDRGFEDREVFVTVDRGDKNVGYFTSHIPIVGAAASGNLGTVGDIFDLH